MSLSLDEPELSLHITEQLNLMEQTALAALAGARAEIARSRERGNEQVQRMEQTALAALAGARAEIARYRERCAVLEQAARDAQREIRRLREEACAALAGAKAEMQRHDREA